MKKYATYKPSDVKWLGEVPAHWKVKRLKFVCSRWAQYGLNESAESYQSEGVRFLRTSDIDDFGNLLGEGVYLPEETTEGYELKNGDLLISRSGTIGRSFLYSAHKHGRCSFAGYLVRYSPTAELLSEFGFYFTKTITYETFLTQVSIAATIGNINGQKFANMALPVPPLPEQRAIATFLDERTAHLDGLIQRKEDLLKLLTEQRAALITRAVMRGLDATAPLRDSRVPWLGQVPTHWEVKRLKFLVASIRGGGTPATENPDFWNGPIPWVSPKDMKMDRISSTEDYVTELALENSSTELVAVDSILLVVRSGILKHTLPVAINTVPVALNQDMKAVIPTKEITPEYLALLLKGLQSEILAFCTKISATVDSIEMDDLVNFDLPIPPLEEQFKICAFITTESAKILPIMNSVDKTVEKLREYRAALITAAVTGRIDVQAAAPTPEPA